MRTAIPPTVMVINDDTVQLHLAVSWLEKDGLHVLACQSAEEALGLLRRGAAVDVIVTDLHMPHIDGWRLCHLLRSPEYAAFNDIPILVLSATFAGADATRLSTALEANAFLPVPYDPALLRAHVRDLLAGRMLQTPLCALIVEHSHTLATLLRRTLEAHGYTVDIAGTGREGLQRLQEQSPALAILDYHLPDMTGDQLLPACTRSLKPIVAIMLTTDPTPELALRFMRLGAYGYLRKPFEPTYLVDLCARALRARALLRVEELLEERTQALYTSEAQYRLLFESIPDAVFVHDAAGTILAMNEVGARWLERPAVDVVGQPISTLLTPYGTPPTGIPHLGTSNGSTTTLRTMSMAHTGRHLTVEVTERPSAFNGQAAILSVVRDVTERERAIVALQAAKDYAENIINSSLDLIVSVDAERHIIAFNTAAQQAFGYEPDEVLGQPVHMLYDAPAVGTGIHHAVLTDGHYTGEIMNRRKDGTTFASYLSASVLRDGQGQMIGVMGISRDITERKQAEAALQASKEAAEAANRSKSAFLANISHEIRTPMNGILGMAELALGTELNGEQREYLELVKVSAEALLGVINDLLDFSKMEAGKLVLDAREFSLRTSVHEAMKALAVPAYCKGLELICEVQPEVPDGLIGDVGRLRQILLNLVGNAIKFTAEGEVVLRIALCPHTDSPALASGHDLVNTCVLHMSVTDTGIGIPAAQQQAIFQPFVQADDSMTRRYGGTGLGLSIAAQLAMLMDGSIWVDSTVGAGSTFHVIVRLGMQPEQSPALPALATLHGLKALIVDDNTTQRHVLQGLLDSWSVCPTLVESGPAALEALRLASQTAQPFAVVILDAHLADEASLTVARWLGRQPAPAPHLIVLAAAIRVGDRQRWQDMYGAVCVTKPVVPTELWEAMRQACLCAPPLTPASAPRPTLEPPDRRPLRVLLAEDNTVNQRLAMRLLEKCGHIVTVVQDGTEALAALRRQTFDVVLLDIQMPHMDGLETTRAIRAREQDTATHVPIVAMTAHAMQGDRERCLAAGMDGYVTKPLRPVELFESIARLTAPALPTPETPSTPGAEPGILDRKTLWERVAGDADLLREIVALFLTDCPECLLEIHAALQRQDCAALAWAAHRLKGALGNISANDALAAVQQVEALARKGDVHAVPEALARLEEELARLTPLLVVYAWDGPPDVGQGYA